MSTLESRDSHPSRPPADAVPLRLVSLDLPDGLSGAVSAECDSINNFVIESLQSPESRCDVPQLRDAVLPLT